MAIKRLFLRILILILLIAPVSGYGADFYYAKVADISDRKSILDRLSFKGTFITCEGRSYRRKQ